MSYNAEASVATATQWVGFHEGQNNDNPFSPWQGLNRYNPWCASFTCYCSVEGGGYRFPDNSTFGIKGEAYTPTTKLRAEQEGIWRDKWWHAQPGDHVLFDWGNNGLIDHVELVIADDGVLIVTIGGNTSDGCYYRTRDRGYVAGFVALSESPQVVVPPPPPPKVRPMFDPALPLRAVLDNPDGGIWLGFDKGRVDFYPANYPTAPKVVGGMLSDEDRKHFQGRALSRLKHRVYTKDGTPKQGFTIIDTRGDTYVPEAQH